MGYEGDAARRLRASLVADRALWRVEAALKLGAPPAPAHEESVEDEEFRVTVDVQPLDLGQASLGALLAPPAEAQGRGPQDPAAAAQAAALMPLFQIFVRVAWTEGLLEREVTRSTFAFDGTAAAQALGAAAGSGSAASRPEGGEPE
jgi:hypothetical protein